ncbi:MAG: hypothetical protein U0R64_03350 [Candidatus Nanopelagicales bacterium]
MDASRAVSRARPVGLTTGDRAALAKHGRPGLLRRLRIQVTAAWSAAASTLVVGMPMLMSDDLTVSDTGMIITMMSLPAMVVAAHAQGRMTRLRADDPTRPVPVAATSTSTDDPAELQELARLRERLAELIDAVEPDFPDVATAMRTADESAHRSLIQQSRALAILADDEDPATVEARAEVRRRLDTGFSEYRHLIAQVAVLLARTDATTTVDRPLRSAADLAATYSEGLRIAEGDQ